MLKFDLTAANVGHAGAPGGAKGTPPILGELDMSYCTLVGKIAVSIKSAREKSTT